MAQRFNFLEEEHIEFIRQQHLFFVATAAAEGRVNVSPKGMDTLKVISQNQVTWLNLEGSGNETAIHIQENGRMTLMFCSFTKKPLILRLYGQAAVIHHGDSQWAELLHLFDEYAGARQIFQLSIDLVQTSCGFAVPFFEYGGERELVKQWKS